MHVYPVFLETDLLQEPLYAHNEYLQLLTEHGIIGLLFFLGLLIGSFYLGLKNRQWGACGALLSLALFSFASYPLQIPSFLITFTFLLAICQVKYQDIVPPPVYYTYSAEPSAKGSDKEAKRALLKNSAVIGFSFFLLAVTYGLLLTEKKDYSRATAFPTDRFAAERESVLYPRFGHYPEFYCEYAQDLTSARQYYASTQLLDKMICYCHHPVIYDILSQNLQASGKYKEAEELLLRIIEQYPGRLNSYYLLAKLYSQPDYYYPDKMKRMARTVLNNNRVVYSRLNSRMEKEMWNLLNSDTKEDNPVTK